jgi:hypothetical protein
MKLLLLRCPRCNHALTPGNDDVVVQCPNCHAAVGISEGGLQLSPAHYAAPTQPQPETWLPFWVYRGQVTFQSRRTQGGRSATQEAQTFWAQPRHIYIPAWACELADARDLVADLLAKQPLLSAVTPPEDAVFLPVALTTEDGHKLLELVIVSLEAQRKDWLESLKFDLRLDGEALWLLPARSDSDGWSLLIKGV